MHQHRPRCQIGACAVAELHLPQRLTILFPSFTREDPMQVRHVPDLNPISRFHLALTLQPNHSGKGVPLAVGPSVQTYARRERSRSPVAASQTIWSLIKCAPSGLNAMQDSPEEPGISL